ncbi:5305_t:CDS:2, partial [Ambispora leptoticha]
PETNKYDSHNALGSELKTLLEILPEKGPISASKRQAVRSLEVGNVSMARVKASGSLARSGECVYGTHGFAVRMKPIKPYPCGLRLSDFITEGKWFARSKRQAVRSLEVGNVSMARVVYDTLLKSNKLQANIDLWNEHMEKLARSEVNRVNMNVTIQRNLENVTITTGMSAGIRHFETLGSELLTSQQGRVIQEKFVKRPENTDTGTALKEDNLDDWDNKEEEEQVVEKENK